MLARWGKCNVKNRHQYRSLSSSLPHRWHRLTLQVGRWMLERKSVKMLQWVGKRKTMAGCGGDQGKVWVHDLSSRLWHDRGHMLLCIYAVFRSHLSIPPPRPLFKCCYFLPAPCLWPIFFSSCIFLRLSVVVVLPRVVFSRKCVAFSPTNSPPPF